MAESMEMIMQKNYNTHSFFSIYDHRITAL